MTLCDVYHIRCHPNVFVYTGYDYKNDEWNTFVISEWRNDMLKLYGYLSDLKLQVGFDNVSKHYPLLHHIINMNNVYDHTGGAFTANMIYNHKEEIEEDGSSSIPFNSVYIRQIDLKKIWHLGNAKKYTSFLDLKIALNEQNCNEFPVPEHVAITKDELEDLIRFTIDDVVAITHFYDMTLGNTDNPLYKGMDKIRLRLDIEKKFKMNCLNASNVQLGRNIVLRLYSKATGKSYSEVKKIVGAGVDEIPLRNCIPEFVNFKTPQMQEMLETFKSTVLREKDKLNLSIYYHGIPLNYGLGGVHGCVKPGIYEVDSEHVIIDEDITSFYPSIVAEFGLYPKHLGIKFLKVYSSIVGTRRQEVKKSNGNKNLIESLKYGSNSIIGKSNEEGSQFYDPMFFYSVTIGGEVLMSKWIEALVTKISDIKMLQVNTDGITYIVNKNELDRVNKIHGYMRILGNFDIKVAKYRKIIIKDVSNYIAIHSDHTEKKPHYKLKGCFEINKEIWHDNSMPIVAKALRDYFIYDIPIKKTVWDSNDILDFCIRIRSGKKHELCQGIHGSDGYHYRKIQNSNRCYVSNHGNFIAKRNPDNNDIEAVIPGKMLNILNTYNPNYNIETYQLDRDYYVAEATKIKNIITNNQLYLFEC